jgi:hypothetical protein
LTKASLSLLVPITRAFQARAKSPSLLRCVSFLQSLLAPGKLPLLLFFGPAWCSTETFVETMLDLFGRCEVAMPNGTG